MNRNDDHRKDPRQDDERPETERQEGERQNDERLLTRLLQDAGRGPRASDAARERVYRTVHEHWSRHVATPQTAAVHSLGAGRAHRRRQWLPFALAAGLGLVALSAYLLRTPATAPGADFASVAVLEGSATLIRDGRELALTAAESGPSPRIGDRLSVPASSGVALRLPTGESLRIAAASDLRFAAADQVRLINGSVYFDSNGVASTRPLAVDSAFGTLRHLGTQYLATVANQSLTLRVREGSVAFSDDSRRLAAMAGEELTIRRSGEPDRRRIGSTDPSWQWAEGLGRLSGADRRPLSEVLEWVARETGRSLRFENDAVAARAQEVVVSGLLGLSAEEAIEALRNTTGFRFALPAAEASLVVTADNP